MRQTVWVCIFWLFSVTVGYAQPEIERYWGFKLGPNLNNIFIDDPISRDSNKPKIGIDIGAFGCIGITPSLSFQPEILFNIRGGKFNYRTFNTVFDTSGNATTTSVLANNNWTLGLVQIPALFKLNMRKKGAKPYFLFGPSIAFSAIRKTKITIAGKTDETTLADANPVQMTGILGLGVSIPIIGKDKLKKKTKNQRFICLDLRYDLGLTNVVKKLGRNTTGSLQLMLGFGF